MILKLVIIYCILQTIAGEKNLTLTVGDPALSARILGGTDATEGQFPFMCSLKQFDEHFCGCAIISRYFVITAARCFDLVNVPKQVKVVAGLTNIEDKLGERHNVRLYIQHPLYEGAPIYRYDIGLIVLKDAFDFSTKVQPIKLLKRAVIPNQHVQVTGWGRVSENGEYARNLKVLRFRVIPNKECTKDFPASVYEGSLCARTRPGNGICYGDWGSPLTYGESLVGLASWSRPCGQGVPDGFTRISHFYDWIIKTQKMCTPF